MSVQKRLILKRLTLLDGAILLCLFLLLVNFFTHTGQLLTPKPAPPLSISTPKGIVSLQQFRNHTVILDFFASWCLPCRLSLPYTEHLYRQYHAKGLEVIGVSLDSDPHQLATFLKRTGATFPAGLPLTNDTLKAYQVQTIPLILLIDKQGRLRWRQEGFNLLAEHHLETLVQTLLKE